MERQVVPDDDDDDDDHDDVDDHSDDHGGDGVLQIVDLSLLVRRDMNVVAADPLSQHMAPVCDSLHMFMHTATGQPAAEGPVCFQLT